MPKTPAPKTSLMRSFANEFENESLNYDKEKSSLVCRCCGSVLGSIQSANMKKSVVVQHIGSQKHRKNLTAFKNQKKLDFTADTFNRDLCRAFMSADIPLHKLNNKPLTEFLERYTGRVLPSESLVRSQFVDECYDATMEEIRSEIKNGPIWICIDETTDKEARAMGHVIVGRLDGENPTRAFLLTSVDIITANNETIIDLFNSSLNLLWPDGVLRDKVFLFISDAAPYMMKAGRKLKIFYNRMLHVSCVVHGLHRVAERIRFRYDLVDKFIALSKTIFLKSPSRIATFRDMNPNLPLPPKPVLVRWATWLNAANYYAEHYHEVVEVIEALNNDDTQAIAKIRKLISKKGPQLVMDLATIKENYVFIVDAITRLQSNKMPLDTSLKIVRECKEKLSEAPDAEISEKISQVFAKNKDLVHFFALNDRDADAVASCPQFKFMTPQELTCFKFAPIISAEVERSFSILKNVLRDNRRSFTCENLRKHVVVTANAAR